MSEIVIEVSGFEKYYDDLHAVRGVDFNVYRGEVVALLGPNGAGKSTLIKAICGLHKPTFGSIKVAGFSSFEKDFEIKSRIGYLPETTPLYFDMLVYDFLNYVGRVRGVKPLRERIFEITKKCGVFHKLSSPIGELSKGLKQRVGLAQAMIGNPDILILDEPTSGLDPNQILEIRQLIRELGREKTVILSTHILSEVEASCDRAVIINQGKVVLDSPVSELLKMKGDQTKFEIGVIKVPKETVFSVFSKNPEISSLEVKEEGKELRVFFTTPSSEDRRETVYEIIRKENWTLTHFEAKSERLESIFRELTTDEVKEVSHA